MKKPLLSYGDTVGIISCSDGMREQQRELLNDVMTQLQSLELKIELADTLFRVQAEFSGTPRKRASELMRLFNDKRIKAIFDISGGDSSNQILPYLNYENIKENPKPYFGISDLTVILNALYTCSNIPTYHYMIRNISDSVEQIKLFENSLIKGKEDIFTYKYTWLRGELMKGIVVGGNIRCFLKLSGTKYLPHPYEKILFLESLGGSANRIGSLLAQLKQIGYLNKLNGIILGTFTQMESENIQPKVEELVLDITKDIKLPIVKTNELGHGKDARCIVIGKELTLEKKH